MVSSKLHGFVRTAVLLHALTTVSVCFSIFLHNLRNPYLGPSGDDASRFDDPGLRVLISGWWTVGLDEANQANQARPTDPSLPAL